MKYERIIYPELSVEIGLSTFSLPEGLPEYHAMVELVNPEADVADQYGRIEEALRLLICRLGAKLVWTRFFVSDAVNQQSFLNVSPTSDAAVSVVQQPPLNGSKVAVWAYLLPDVQLLKEGSNDLVMLHGGYRHLYQTQLCSSDGDETAQTTTIFSRYIEQLKKHQCTLASDCIRTWIYVQGVDTHYKGMVDARKACFEAEGLTPETHFIASTGIEGKYINPAALVLMDAYAVQGLQPQQVRYLYAPTHLNPTHEYGVTFERGTAVQYGDRRHVFISGTASIDNRGAIVHPLDITRQIVRMFENIRTLLTEADSDMCDIAHVIVYLRDPADYRVVLTYLKQTYPDIPAVILWAPVCRPGWLIEAECMAVKAIEDKRFAAY